jgi:putative membrane protein
MSVRGQRRIYLAHSAGRAIAEPAVARRGPRVRHVLLPLGLLLLAAVWLGPLPGLATHAFFAHMTMHMGVVAVAAPLVALGISGTRFDPVARLPALFSPLPASVLEFLVVWSWHVPQLHHAARSTGAGLVAEQATFFVAALLVWLSSVSSSEGGGGRATAGVLALLLTFMHMTLLGALLALAQRPLYPHGGGAFGLSPLDDQHVGGAIMLVGGAAYLLGGVWLTARLVRDGAFAGSSERGA